VNRRSGGPRQKVAGVFVFICGLALVGVLAAGGWVMSVAGEAPNVNAMKPVNKGLNSIIYAGDGSRLGLIDSDEFRRPVPLSDIPEDLQNATIAIEDERFYRHNGIDIQGGIRALVRNIEAGGISEGASTITMQLMRNLYMKNPARDLERKIIEARMAVDFERENSKKKIIQAYLNSAPYGTNEGKTAIGVEAASRVYFSKGVSELTLPQAALLAGLPQAPTDYNPVLNPSGATKRRNEVLTSMADLGMITRSEAKAAKARGLGLTPKTGIFDRQQPFFFDYVESELIKEYGVERVRRGGLKVFTTVEPSLQQAGVDAIAGTLTYSDDPSAALVAIDPRTGDVKAMVSSSSYEESQYNLAAQGRRQPGSTFKTFTLAAAINEGMDPNSTYYESKPLFINSPVWGEWDVSTYSDSYAGTTSVAKATLSSDNSVYAQLALDIGPDKVAEMAEAMGITSKLNGYPAETLGGLEVGVSPLEMASAYATLASGGIRRSPVAIEKVVFPDGEVDRPDRPNPERVMSDGAAYEVTQILHGNMTGGTGTGAYTGCSGQAGKTGTTDNFTDAWFAGYQPNLSTATWVGYPESNQISMTSVHGISVAGGTFPADIWGRFYSYGAIPCEAAPYPTEPVDWSSFTGDYTVSADTPSDYGAPEETDEENGNQDGNQGGGNNDGGQAPAPAPAPAPTPAPSPGGGGVSPGGGISPG
jgi:penicillin-binding protein 1A